MRRFQAREARVAAVRRRRDGDRRGGGDVPERHGRSASADSAGAGSGPVRDGAIDIVVRNATTLLGAIGHLLKRVLVEPFQRRIRRERAVSRLLTMSDHQLRDIGLTRFDLQAGALGRYGKAGYESIDGPASSEESEPAAAPAGAAPQPVAPRRDRRRPTAASAPICAPGHPRSKPRRRAGGRG